MPTYSEPGLFYKETPDAGLDSIYAKVIIDAEDYEITLNIDEILTLKIIERMDYFFYTGTIEYFDVGSGFEYAKVNGNEKVKVQIGSGPDNFNEFNMKIWNITHSQVTGDQGIPNKYIRLELIAEKAFENKFMNWSFGIKPIHERVTEIISELGLTPNVHLCKGPGPEQDKIYILPRATCQEAIYDCMKYAINGKFETCDYVSYQCHEDKMNFCSLTELKMKGEPKEEFVENATDKENAKMNEMYHMGTMKIDPGFCFYNANKVLTSGYDYMSGKYVSSEKSFSEAVQGMKMSGSKGGFPILTENETEVQKVVVDYFLQKEDPWLDTLAKSDIFNSHKRLFLGDFLTFANAKRKLGDIVQIRVKSGDPVAREFNKLFFGNVLVFGIVHYVSQMQYYQKLLVWRDAYYSAKKGLIM